ARAAARYDWPTLVRSRREEGCVIRHSGKHSVVVASLVTIWALASAGAVVRGSGAHSAQSAQPAQSTETPAAARDYWAFKLPVAAPVPSTPTLTHPIDRFLEHERQTHGLTRAPRADRLTLLRRAYLDLIGLPPTPDQISAFLADDTPQAWER